MSPATPHPATPRRRGGPLALVLVLATFAGLILAPAAEAASGEIAIFANNAPPQPSGAATEYTLNFSCSTLEGETCGTAPEIRIPLALTAPVDPATPPMAGWTYAVESDIEDLIASAAVEGGEYVIKLDPAKFKSGDSDTIQLWVTPPNGTTPDGTAWSLLPSLTSDTIPVVQAAQAALGEASAETSLSVTKNTNDGGSVYVSGNKVIYNITARCNSGTPTGRLFMTGGSLVDQLPAGLDFVSATPTPTSAPDPGESGTVTWSFPTPESLPPGCAAGSSGSASYQLIGEIPPGTPDDTSLLNEVTFSGQPLGAGEPPLSSSAPKAITVISLPPVSPGQFLAKAAQGPLNIPGYGFAATYPGHWITPANPAPAPTRARPRGGTRSPSPTPPRAPSKPTSPTRCPASTTRRASSTPR